MARKVSVAVPATSANLGPGFDCLGIALDIFNRVTIEAASDFSLTCSGEGADILPRTTENRVYQAIAAVYERAELPVPPLNIACHNEIPLMRGLGSSSAAAVAGLVAAQRFSGARLKADDLLAMAASFDGHADNVTPALFGGCQVVVTLEQGYRHAPVPLPKDLEFALFIPDFAMSTAEGRAVLPAQVSRRDAVFNIGRAAMLTAAFATGALDLLGTATEDRLHQPARQAIFPAMPAIIAAARQAGAHGSFLSGAGSTIAALCSCNAAAVAAAMQAAAGKAGVSGKARTAHPTAKGALDLIS